MTIVKVNHRISSINKVTINEQMLYHNKYGILN